MRAEQQHLKRPSPTQRLQSIVRVLRLLEARRQVALALAAAAAAVAALRGMQIPQRRQPAHLSSERARKCLNLHRRRCERNISGRRASEREREGCWSMACVYTKAVWIRPQKFQTPSLSLQGLLGGPLDLNNLHVGARACLSARVL